MEHGIDPEKIDEQNINKADIPSCPEVPSNNEPRNNNVCQKDKDPFARFIAILALITSIAAAGFGGWQVYIASDTAKRQLRAYIVQDSIVFKKIGTPITLKLIVNNMGQTPAYNVSQACIFLVAKNPKNYSTAEFKKDTHHGIAIIGKEQITFDNVSTISDGDVSHVLSKNLKLFYYAIVRYNDIFKQSHVLHVCSEYSVESNSFIAMPDCNYEE